MHSFILPFSAINQEEYVSEHLEYYEELREEYLDGLDNKKLVEYSLAKEKSFKIDFVAHPPAPKPKSLGATKIEYALEDIIPLIDWGPFFSTWELRGKYPNRGYPKIFNDATVGEEAKKLFADAQTMLKEITEQKLLQVRGLVGLYPANTVGDDVQVYPVEEDEKRSDPKATFCMLRQQRLKEDADVNQ